MLLHLMMDKLNVIPVVLPENKIILPFSLVLPEEVELGLGINLDSR